MTKRGLGRSSSSTSKGKRGSCGDTETQKVRESCDIIHLGVSTCTHVKQFIFLYREGKKQSRGENLSAKTEGAPLLPLLQQRHRRWNFHVFITNCNCILSLKVWLRRSLRPWERGRRRRPPSSPTPRSAECFVWSVLWWLWQLRPSSSPRGRHPVMWSSMLGSEWRMWSEEWGEDEEVFPVILSSFPTFLQNFFRLSLKSFY